MMASVKSLKNDIIYFLTKGFIFIFQNISRKSSLALGRFFGEIAALVDVKERELAEKNLTRVYGDSWNEQKVKLIAKDCFVKLGLNAADVIQSGKWDSDRLANLIETEGMEHFDEAFAQGKGVIGLTGHIGNFELMAAWFASVKKAPLSVIGRQLYDKRLDKLLVENRERFGLENISSDESPKKIISLLKNGGFLGVLLDLDSNKVAGYFAPFFGIPANTAAGPVVIGRRTGSPVAPMAMFRTEDDRYLLKVLPSFELPNTDDKDADILNGLTQCNKALEEQINYDPTQWMWIHNRWKREPNEPGNVLNKLEEVK